MAAARETTDTTLIKPLKDAIVRRYTAGSAIAVGEAVAMASDGFIDPTDASAVNYPLGIALQAAGAAGERIDVVVHGPVVCMTGATVGALIYTTNTAGEFAESAGTKTSILGVAESATVLFVRPQIVTLS
jgi:hypothetical protein